MPPSLPPRTCHPIYGNGDCSEFGFCGDALGRGECHKGLCVCMPGYGGQACELEAICHVWDEATVGWSAEGVTTLRATSDVGMTSDVATTGVVRCTLDRLPVTTTSYAAIWTRLPPPAPTFGNLNVPSAGLAMLGVGSNPIALAVILLMLLNCLSLWSLWRLRHVKGIDGHGLLGEWKFNPKEQFSLKPQAFWAQYVQPRVDACGRVMAQLKPKMPNRGAKDPNVVIPTVGDGAEGRSGPLALEAPKDEPPPSPAKKLPTLLASFQIEGDLATFDDASLLRRLATLLGVSDSNVGATLSVGKAPNTMIVDSEIGCPDATTLVMSAKMLKAGIGALGLALGVKLIERPLIDVMALPETEAPREAADPKKSKTSDKLAESVIPTIQERIPSLGGGGRRALRGLLPQLCEDTSPTSARASPAVPTDTPWSSSASEEGPFGAQSSGDDPADPACGIQERIPLPGFGAARRTTNASARVLRAGASAASTSAASVLESLGLSLSEDLAKATGGSSSNPSGTVAHSLHDGIQERLPVRPSMRRRGGTDGAGTSRAPRSVLASTLAADPIGSGALRGLPSAAGRSGAATPLPPPAPYSPGPATFPSSAVLPTSFAQDLTGTATELVSGTTVLQERVPRLLRGTGPASREPPPPSPGTAQARFNVQAVDKARAAENMRAKAVERHAHVEDARLAYRARAEYKGEECADGEPTPRPPNALSPPPSPPQVLPSPSTRATAGKPLHGSSDTSSDTTLAIVQPVDLDADPKSTNTLWIPSMTTGRMAKFTNPAHVLPQMPEKEWTRSKNLEETWDDRSPSEIAWGAVREHTLFGCVAAVLWGSGPKLATLAQAVQLFWNVTFGLIYLSCVQLRYGWLGGAWVDVPVGAGLLERLSAVSAVAVAAALVCLPCVLVARWFFLFANRTRKCTDPKGRTGTLVEGGAWAIVLTGCFILAVSSIAISTSMETNTVREDAMISWTLAMGMQWLLLEPIALLVFGGTGLLLKWCTDFEVSTEVKLAALHAQREQLQGEIGQWVAQFLAQHLCEPTEKEKASSSKHRELNHRLKELDAKIAAVKLQPPSDAPTGAIVPSYMKMHPGSFSTVSGQNPVTPRPDSPVVQT